MLKVHTRDGVTTKVDLENEEQLVAWRERLKDPKYQRTITGLTVIHLGVQYSLSAPVGFHHVSFEAEGLAPDASCRLKGGERIVCMADGVRISLMVHREQKAVRVLVAKVGRQRFSPGLG